MQNKTTQNGMKLLVRKYRRQFRIPENLDHYTDKDYKTAEQKYIKMCVLKGNCNRVSSKY